MKNQLIKIFLWAALVFVNSHVQAGGNLKAQVQTFQDERVTKANFVDITWDTRCMPNHFVLDSTLPNSGTADEVTIETLQKVIQASMDEWNNIKTSFVELNLMEVRDIEAASYGLDFVNTITFEPDFSTFGPLAFSPSVALTEDTDFIPGLDVDGDGDSDVFDPEQAGINTCFDYDKDGDIEFPAGFYSAGTILDNDVIFNAAFLWGTEIPQDNDGYVDIQAVAMHEFGHSIGLAHSPINQISASDPSASSMYPSIKFQNAFAELDQRELNEDEIAYASMYYPEGSAIAGPAALQVGDVAFDDMYGIIEGVVNGNDDVFGFPVSGGIVTAVSGEDNRALVTAYSEGVRLTIINDTSQTFVYSEGTYRLPVPKGLYNLRLSGLDGTPIRATQVNRAVGFGVRLGKMDFEHEFYSGVAESSSELLDYPTAIYVGPGETKAAINFTVNNNERLFDLPISYVYGFSDVSPGTRYAQRFDRRDIIRLLDSGKLFNMARVLTSAEDVSVVPYFESIMVALGTANEDGTYTIDTDSPLVEQSPFIGLFEDQSQFRFKDPYFVSFLIHYWLTNDPQKELFLVLELPNVDAFPGPSAAPPTIGFVPNTNGKAFSSLSGNVFQPAMMDFDFTLEAI